jgi:hypothetical protein
MLASKLARMFPFIQRPLGTAKSGEGRICFAVRTGTNLRNYGTQGFPQTPHAVGSIWEHMTERCAEYGRLASEVEQILADLTQTTTLQLELFRSRRYPDFMNVDKELELMVGRKERAIGALRGHAKAHGCQPRLPDE